MRTLIIDNYDSFTYNLYQALAAIDGARPTVVRNDEDWDLGGLVDFDNVVISPGPGHPGVHRDMGLSRAVLAAARQPLLGVCLGHQGLCLLAGAEVTRAPEVRHGRLSEVRHDGRELFAGIPSPMRVVRYHSLAVEDLPDELEATAWAEDGVLMGVRHRERPAWGVQFHPESVCTEHGDALLANFADLTRRWWAEHPRETVVAAPVPEAHHPEPPPAARVHVRKLTVPVTAEETFDALYRDSAHAFWLDSATGGRFSFLGDAAGPLARVATADVWTGQVTITSRTGVEVVQDEFLAWLDADLARWRVEVPDLPFGFALGWVGYLGYELKAECGADRVHHSPDPDAQLVFVDRAVVFDHATGEVYLLAFDAEWAEQTAARLVDLAAAPASAQPVERGVVADALTPRHDRAAYLAMIDECQAAIADGETYEVCLTNVLTAGATIDPWQAYRYLRRKSPAPFGALLRFGDLSVLSTSPERFLSVTASGLVESRPIKGTRPRGRTEAEDEALRHDLATDEKDRAENLMIVDLVRNDLGVYAEIGSVHVPGLFEVETYATVHHLVSTVRAQLSEGVSAVRCVRAAFPGGSMTGAPKVRTMEIIDRLERGPRGVYSGAIGYFSLSGAADLSMVIRTLVARPGQVGFGVGGAIIALSDPAGEYEETAVKATTMLGLLDAEFPDRVRAS
ncbi:para-aminobenzoate synthetase [Actinokineospora alba]|uniref:aminodeoxychorismate synthase n=1 Tax=Actinokineospora alba TaxID=504798 RepID=A0A1H0VTY1_9PSEU|nr:aminodeoxychorismate synthase component I [Actinokineospora alba]TDP70105.1 para-aminobenzoate synthetase [Actinokineospora alba]SDI38937.1 para-aminobenzoate synthetase [Actinokineospora alba]SDP81625.1 para-aminobenzoate synthetase [Actinokineospora alba]